MRFMAMASVVCASRLIEPNGTSYSQGYQVVEYPHTTRRHVLRAPEVAVKSLDVKVKPNLTVGYVMGVGDESARRPSSSSAPASSCSARTISPGAT